MELLDFAKANPLSLQTLVMHLALGLGLALLLSWHFRRFASTLTNRNEFSRTFPFIVMTTILIISVVKSSLALSLGLVGALSIVRFRTPIKEPEELAYLFMGIAIGLGLGADQVLPTLSASGFILVSVGLVKGIGTSKGQRNLFLSLDWQEDGEGGGHGEVLAEVERVLSDHSSAADLRRCDARKGQLEATYLVEVSDRQAVSGLITGLRARFPNMGVTFLDQSPKPSD